MKYDLTILKCLMERPRYGYELKKVIENTLITCDSTGSGFSSSMIYPSLAKFEKDGVIEKKVLYQDGKPNRNIYEMTAAGKRFFCAFVNDITPKTIYDRELFYYRLTVFPYLTRESREKLLSGRRTYLEQAVAYNYRRRAEELNDYMRDLNEFTISLEELELRHIAFFENHLSDPCLAEAGAAE